jgi:hypothetical protein
MKKAAAVKPPPQKFSSVIPGRAQREPQMRNCAPGNLEIPGLVGPSRKDGVH